MATAAHEHQPSRASALRPESSEHDPGLKDRLRAELERRAQLHPDQAGHYRRLAATLDSPGVLTVGGLPPWSAPTPEEAERRRAGRRAERERIQALLASGAPPESVGPRLDGALDRILRRQQAAG